MLIVHSFILNKHLILVRVVVLLEPIWKWEYTLDQSVAGHQAHMHSHIVIHSYEQFSTANPVNQRTQRKPTWRCFGRQEETEELGGKTQGHGEKHVTPHRQ